MPREQKTPTPKQKRGNLPRSSIPKQGRAPLTEAEQVFQEHLKKCLPQERDFIRYKLMGLNNTEAAKRAGYSEKTAEEQGARLLGRVRVSEAYQAGLAAAGFGPQDILADIQAIRAFDPSIVEREVKEVEHVPVPRRSEELIQESLQKERVLQDFIDNLDPDDPSIVEGYKKRLHKLLRDRLELELAVTTDPDHITYVPTPTLVSRWVVDEAKIRELGLRKFVKSRKQTPYGWSYEFYSWIDGVQMAAKTSGLFVERRELSGPGGAPIQSELDISKLSAAELAEHYNRLLEEDTS